MERVEDGVEVRRGKDRGEESWTDIWAERERVAALSASGASVGDAAGWQLHGGLPARGPQPLYRIQLPHTSKHTQDQRPDLL